MTDVKHKLRSRTNRLVVHCSDTPPNMDIGVAEIRQWHTRERKWKDIGYHYVIRRNGDVEVGRPRDAIGAGVVGYNAGSIHICLVGGRKAGNRLEPEANFATVQFESLYSLLRLLKQLYPAASVVGHRDLDPHKACPSFDVKAWWLHGVVEK